MTTKLFAIVGFLGDPRPGYDEGDVVCEYATGLMNQTNDHTPYQAEAIERLMDHEAESLDVILSDREESIRQQLYDAERDHRPDSVIDDITTQLEGVKELRDALKEGRYVKLP